MGIEQEDISGTPPSRKDVDEAEAIIRKVLVVWIAKVPPELAVNAANIHRCLKYLREIMP